MLAKVSEATFKLPLERPPQYDAMVATAGKQSATIKQNPGYPGKPTIQAAVAKVDGDAGDLAQKLVKLAGARAQVAALEGDVGTSALALLRDHDALETLLNQDCAGDEQAMIKWGGEKATRTPVPPTTAAPTNVRATATDEEGAVVARCKAERSVVCYLFQMGTDAANPQGWPPAAIEAGASHRVTGLTVGQKVYFRVAIVRRGTGQGQWSDIVGVTVK